MEETTCVIAGGGPAGMMLGLLLARAGVKVVVLEKHADFLRDFRGDTVHPSTLEILDELGLGARFAGLPQRHARKITAVTDTDTVTIGDLSQLRGRHPYIAFVPQWDFLDLLAEAARAFPNFDLRMRCEALSFTGDGVLYRDPEGAERRIRADLTVAADGRSSVLRAGLPLREHGAPMDVGWFRLPRVPDDPEDPILRLGTGKMMVAINRETYWQLGYIVPKGDPVEDPETVRPHVAKLLPFLAGRVAEIDAISRLTVQVNRLRRWHRPGLLCIGDAAHAMSPVLGVGINLAVQDAVAAANLLYRPLLEGNLSSRHLAAVQRRRTPATVVIQRLQLTIQDRVIAPALEGASPPPVRYLSYVRPLQRAAVSLIAKGLRPEHVQVPLAPAER
ncbi:FAD-dependent oxidoreductase [Actinocorallia longicatena]|uniref:FAD-dependent oxidoreductase n=1 Tax=Actinocorallia longicatena TaxID=111803 RepID=A0ABP6QDP4_9ACTN